MKLPFRFVMARSMSKYFPPMFAQRMGSWLYPDAMARKSNLEVITRLVTGSYFQNRLDNYAAGLSALIHGYYEWRSLAVVIAAYHPGDTVIEIGAHIGTETLILSDIVGTEGLVVAFEPLPQNVEVLKKNLALNKKENVRIFDKAVSSSSDKMVFTLPSATDTSVGHLQFDQGEGASGASLWVDVVSLDDLYQAEKIPPAQIVMINAEGAEPDILRGAETYLSLNKPLLILEAHVKILRRAGHQIGDLYQQLTDWGYAIYAIRRFGLLPVTVYNQEDFEKGYYNWLCINEQQIDLLPKIKRYLYWCSWAPCLPGVNPLVRK